MTKVEDVQPGFAAAGDVVAVPSRKILLAKITVAM
jgi:hypothetical protein